uniref:Uncharacterized protein n=1 Tax=Eptatretus burgeri TaxID=7764 RepID=A0A8C4Q6P7_EPTBU
MVVYSTADVEVASVIRKCQHINKLRGIVDLTIAITTLPTKLDKLCFHMQFVFISRESCVDNCAGKLIQSNHRVMLSYVELMPEMVQRRVAEMQAKMEKQEGGHTEV